MCTLIYVPPPSPCPFTQPRQNLIHQTHRSIKVNTSPKIYNTGITYCVIPQIFLISCGLITLLWWLLLRLCVYVRYVPFNVNLNLFRAKLYVQREHPSTYLLFIILFFSICANSSFDSVIKVSLLFRKTISNIISIVVCIYITRKVPQSFVIILILLSNDIHVNPGPYCENNLKFMNWNVNSVAKDNFQRVRLT